MNNTVRVGVVLPVTHWGDEEWKNVQPALDYADEAGRQGVQLLVYPEGYPGPMTGSLSIKATKERPIHALQEKAKHSMFIAAGEVEPNPDKPETYFLSLKLISDEGHILAIYFRTQPDTPPLNAYLYHGKAQLMPGKESSVVAPREYRAANLLRAVGTRAVPHINAAGRRDSGGTGAWLT